MICLATSQVHQACLNVFYDCIHFRNKRSGLGSVEGFNYNGGL